MKVLVTGASGRFGRLVVEALARDGHEVIGLDLRPWDDPPEGVSVVATDLLKRGTENVFREHRPDAVVHTASGSHLKVFSHDRYRVNLGGAKAVFDYAHTYGAKKAVFVGRHTYYGANPDSPLYHSEDDPPLGIETYPELADLVAADLFACSALWRYSSVESVVLRVCYTLGPSRHGNLADYLRGPRVATIAGFNPLFQFIHEQDAVRAVLASLRQGVRGVFNVAGPDPLPLSVLIERAGRTVVPMPEAAFRLVGGRFGFPKLLAGAARHIKFPVVIDSSAFEGETGFEALYGQEETIAAFRKA